MIRIARCETTDEGGKRKLATAILKTYSTPGKKLFVDGRAKNEETRSRPGFSLFVGFARVRAAVWGWAGTTDVDNHKARTCQVERGKELYLGEERKTGGGGGGGEKGKVATVSWGNGQ